MQLNKGSQGFRLLTPGNPKTEKGRAQGYWTFIMHFAPADLSGFNVCALSTAGCRKACLNTAGRGGIKAGTGILSYNRVKRGIRNEIQRARRLRTRAFFQFRAEFMQELAKEIAKAILKARRAGYIPVFRLNGTSDIRWESVPVAGFPNIMSLFSDVQFYDYTKLPNRKNIPANYHLTFSLADGNDTMARRCLGQWHERRSCVPLKGNRRALHGVGHRHRRNIRSGISRRRYGPAFPRYTASLHRPLRQGQRQTRPHRLCEGLT